MKSMKRRLTPVRILALGFFALILIGTILLMLPISSKSGEVTNFIDAFFTATSATCITGLVTLKTAYHWTYFGATVIIILVQIGGLGFMSLATLFSLILGKRITLKERLVLQEATNSFSLQGIVKLEKYIIIFTFAVEGIGALFLSTQFIPEYGLAKGIYFSIFHAIAGFCNAGFDLTGNSLVPYRENPVIILTISLFSTTGNTMGLTPNLSVIGKILIAFTMYIGRLGPFTIVLALSRKKKERLIKYPEGKILIG